jgi:hypothetical protein
MRRSFFPALLVLAMSAATAAAQQAAPALADAPQVSIAVQTANDTVATTNSVAMMDVSGAVAAPVAVTRDRDAATAPMAMQSRSPRGQPVALMAVGVAALVAGAVIGDDVGTMFMVGGGVLGLYGLYLYLR